LVFFIGGDPSILCWCQYDGVLLVLLPRKWLKKFVVNSARFRELWKVLENLILKDVFQLPQLLLLKKCFLQVSLRLPLQSLSDFVLGKEALGGTLAGATVTGVLLALFMANAGGAWDNAKKAIEQGQVEGESKGDRSSQSCCYW
jgi:hypothetical protein